MNRLNHAVRNLTVRATSARAVLVAASLVALVAWGTSALDIPHVLIGWLAVVAAALYQVKLKNEERETPVADRHEHDAPLDFGDMPRFLDEIDLAIYVLNVDGSVLFQNRSAGDTFGTFPIGAHISARMRAPGVLDIVRDTLSSGRSNQIEYSERLPSERVYLVRSASVAATAEAGGRPTFLLMFRDVSESRRIDRMRSDFVANASHELRTPLASLRGYIETLQGPAKGDAKAQERFLPIMLDQATRMSRLVDDLMSLSRLEVRAHLPPDQTIELAPLIEHVRDSLLPLANELGVGISLHMPDEPVYVQGDKDELVEVFENLMENACKYGSDGEKIDVHLKHLSPRGAEVSVIDYGPGIPAEHVPRLTERFYRVSVADSRSKKGTGLGLAIVKHILTRHRARLIVRSEVGKGTTFIVRF